MKKEKLQGWIDSIKKIDEEISEESNSCRDHKRASYFSHVSGRIDLVLEAMANIEKDKPLSSDEYTEMTSLEHQCIESYMENGDLSVILGHAEQMLSVDKYKKFKELRDRYLSLGHE